MTASSLAWSVITTKKCLTCDVGSPMPKAGSLRARLESSTSFGTTTARPEALLPARTGRLVTHLARTAVALYPTRLVVLAAPARVADALGFVGCTGRVVAALPVCVAEPVRRAALLALPSRAAADLEVDVVAAVFALRAGVARAALERTGLIRIARFDDVPVAQAVVAFLQRALPASLGILFARRSVALRVVRVAQVPFAQ